MSRFSEVGCALAKHGWLPRLCSKKWYVFLGVIFLMGLPLCACPPEWMFLSPLSTRVRPWAWSRLIGIYLVSIALTNFLVAILVSRLKNWLVLDEQASPVTNTRASALVGLCESILYPTAFISERFEFVGVWLAIKGVSQWAGWKEDPEQTCQKVEVGGDSKAFRARRRFNAFLVGNALSLMAAGVTWAALKIWVLL